MRSLQCSFLLAGHNRVRMDPAEFAVPGKPQQLWLDGLLLSSRLEASQAHQMRSGLGAIVNSRVCTDRQNKLPIQVRYKY